MFTDKVHRAPSISSNDVSTASILHNAVLCTVAPIIVHCTTGVCAAEAKIILKSNGYTEVLNVGRFRDLQLILTAAEQQQQTDS